MSPSLQLIPNNASFIQRVVSKNVLSVSRTGKAHQFCKEESIIRVPKGRAISSQRHAQGCSGDSGSKKKVCQEALLWFPWEGLGKERLGNWHA